MTDLKERLKKLTPEQRAALERQLILKKATQAEKDKAYGKIVAIKDHSPAPLSFAQKRLWYLDRLDPGSSAYNIFGGSSIQGEIDIIRLEKCISEIVRKHESLRTIFRLQNNKPVQMVMPPHPYTIEFIDLTTETSSRQSDMLQNVVEHVFRRHFDLGELPLFHIAIVRLAEQDHVAVMSIHHIISDAWSTGVFFKEMNHLYAVYGKDESPNLFQPLPVQYADYAIWQQKWSRSKRFEEHATYWKSKLGGELTTLNLPTDYDRPPFQTTSGAFEEMELSPGLVDRLRILSRDNQASINMVLLSAFKVLLYRLSGQTDILVGSPIAGRHHVEVENLVGFFINTIVLRTDLSRNPTFSKLLARVRETVLETFTHQDFPFEKIVEFLSPERDLSRTPIFQVFFNHINMQIQENNQSYFPAKGLETYQYQSKFDITLYVLEYEKKIRLELVYNSNLFKKQHMVEFIRQYYSIVLQVLENPRITINKIDLITQSAEGVLPNPNKRLPVLWEGHVLDRIHHHAQQVPDKAAIEENHNVLNYGQLEQQIHFFANRLEQQGVTPGEIVAVIGDRSADFVCSLLAIMKAGGAFSILDPTYPSHRLVQYINEIRPRFLLPIGSDKERIETVTRQNRSTNKKNE
jgi:hypothetical protein